MNITEIAAIADVLAAIGVIASLLSDRFLSPLNINNVLMQGAVITVITIGMTYVIICGGFDLSVGSVAAFSGCVAAEVMLETNIVLGVGAGIAIGAGVGWINGFIVTKLRVNAFIATLGTMVLFRGSSFVTWRTISRPLRLGTIISIITRSGLVSLQPFRPSSPSPLWPARVKLRRSSTSRQTSSLRMVWSSMT